MIVSSSYKVKLYVINLHRTSRNIFSVVKCPLHMLILSQQIILLLEFIVIGWLEH